MATMDSILVNTNSRYIKLNTKKRSDLDDVIDSSIIKKSRPDKLDKLDKNYKYIIINGKRYSIQLEKLNKLEPDNILCNIRSREFKTFYNVETGILEYLETIPDVEYIIDYLRGYDISCFDKIFHSHEKNDLPRFKTILARLKLSNFLNIINTSYPFITIGIFTNSRIITREIANTLEPQNKLFNPETKTYPDGHEYYHNRDEEIFNEWVWPYISGNSDMTREKLVKKIMLFLSGMKHNPEMKSKYEYKYNKILEDIQYYGLKKLQFALLDSTNAEIQHIINAES
jgi:hypothetical protein